MQRRLAASGIRAKLSVSEPGDPDEREADHVADAVASGAPTPPIQRKSADGAPCDSREPEPLQRKSERASGDGVAHAATRAATALRGGGQPLPRGVRADLEGRLGHDLGGVRVHTHAAAETAARDLGARAYTQGQDIGFAPGEFAPASSSGRHLLAHEVAHVLQQDPHAQRIRRQQDAGAGGAAGAAARTEERSQIDTALASRDPGDVKGIHAFWLASDAEKFTLIRILLDQGWVGPRDEYSLEDIWASFGDRLIETASKNMALWNECIDRGAELDDLPAVAALKDEFTQDIKAIVSRYLEFNRNFVLAEIERFGLSASPTDEAPATTPEQAEDIQGMQRAAAEVAKLQRAQEAARDIVVGFDINPSAPVFEPGLGQDRSAFTPPPQPMSVPAFFNPAGPPAFAEDPDPGMRAMNALFGTSGQKGVTPWQTVKEQYDKAAESIKGYLELYPALYAVSREAQSTVTGGFAGIADPQQARKQLGESMRALIADIEGTQFKLDGGDLDPLDLTPIHDQLFAGVKSDSGIDWTAALPQHIAKDMVSGHQFAQALESLGLQTAAAALFMLAPFTGGASLFVMLAGLAVTGVKLYLSTEQYETLSQAARSSPTPGTELVPRARVDEAKMAMDADTADFALAALAVGAAAVGSILAGFRAPPTQRILIVGAETEGEFAEAGALVKRGHQVTVANPVSTEHAEAFSAQGGNFQQVPIEQLPPGQTFNQIRENYPFPLGRAFQPTAEFVEARMVRLAPGGRWVVITEDPEFAQTLQAAGQMRGVTVNTTEIPLESAPPSNWPRATTRFEVTFTQPQQ